MACIYCNCFQSGRCSFSILSRWISDSRDEFTRERLAQINDTMKLYRSAAVDFLCWSELSIHPKATLQAFSLPPAPL